MTSTALLLSDSEADDRNKTSQPHHQPSHSQTSSFSEQPSGFQSLKDLTDSPAPPRSRSASPLLPPTTTTASEEQFTYLSPEADHHHHLLHLDPDDLMIRAQSVISASAASDDWTHAHTQKPLGHLQAHAKKSEEVVTSEASSSQYTSFGQVLATDASPKAARSDPSAEEEARKSSSSSSRWWWWWKKLACRDAACCLCGVVCGLIACVAGFLGFVLLTNSTRHEMSAQVPSTVSVVNSTVGSDSVLLHWSSAREHGSAVDFYQLEYSSSFFSAAAGEEEWKDYALSDDGLYGQALVQHLRGNGSYRFRVRAHNDVGYANWSAPFAVRTLEATVPMPPLYPFGIETETVPVALTTDGRNRSRSRSRDDEVVMRLAWNVDSDGGAPLTDFVVYALVDHDHHDHGANLSSSSSFFGKEKMVEFCQVEVEEYEMLKPSALYNCSGTVRTSVLYEFVVVASNQVGDSNASLVTPCIVPQSNIDYLMCLPSKPPARIEQDEIDVQAASYEIDMQWTAPDSQYYISGYQVQRDDWWNATTLFNVSDPRQVPNHGLDLYAKLGGLLPGAPYHLRVRAANQFGAGEWSPLLTVSTPDTGACGNFEDLNVLKTYCTSLDTGMIEIYVQCSTDKSGQRDQCQKQAMEKQYGFSGDCSTCFVEFNGF